MNPNKKQIAIHQPNFIPWLGYFYKIYSSDIFIFLDDVQYSNQGMHNYHYIKTPNGSLRLKVPVKQKLGTLISDIKINNDIQWRKKLLRTFEMNYKKAKYFDEVFSDMQYLIDVEIEYLSLYNVFIIKYLIDKLNINTPTIFSSELETNGASTEKIINICKNLDATDYLSGNGAKAYQDEERFKSKGLSLNYLNFKPFKYTQLWGNFISNVSVIDFLMHYGYNWEIVLSKQKN